MLYYGWCLCRQVDGRMLREIIRMIVLALLAFSLVIAADNTGDVDQLPTLCSDVESTGDEESPCVEELSLEPTEEEQPFSPLSVEDEDDDDYDTRGTYIIHVCIVCSRIKCNPSYG